jgi:hypothetical protein
MYDENETMAGSVCLGDLPGVPAVFDVAPTLQNDHTAKNPN